MVGDRNRTGNRRDRGPRIVVIGGGQSARWLLFALLNETLNENVPLRRAHITVVEARREFGTGLAWSRDYALDEHLGSTCRPLSRCAHGDKQQLQFDSTVEMLRRTGIDVALMPGQTAHGIRTSGAREVLLASGARIPYDVIILATGHGLSTSGHGRASMAVDGHPRVHGSPWPAKLLADRVFGNDGGTTGHARRILVLGSYLGAIDAVITLALRVGRFRSNGDRSLWFEGPPGVHFVLASRSGQLPRVWAYAPDAVPAPEFFSSDRLDDARRLAGTGFLSLDTAFDLLLRELARLSAPVPSLRRGSSPRTVIRTWQRQGRRVTPTTVLRHDLRVADTLQRSAGEASDNPLRWQAIIDEALQLWSESSPAFSAEDQLWFDRNARTTFFGHMLPMTAASARQLDAMLRSGHLSVRPLGRRYTVAPSTSGDLSLIDACGRRDERFSDVVDATASTADIRRHPSPLIQDLLYRGTIQATLRRFENSSNAQRCPDSIEKNVEWFGGNAWLRTAAIYVDSATCVAIPRGRTGQAPQSTDPGGRVYAMGPLVLGQFTDAQSFGQAQRDARRITTDMARWWTVASAEEEIAHDIDR